MYKLDIFLVQPGKKCQFERPNWKKTIDRIEKYCIELLII